MKSTNRNMLILFFTLVVVMLGFGMVIPIFPFYIEKLGASGQELGILMAIFAVMQFLFAPVWGQLSDRYGRKPILLLGVVGNAVSLVLFGLSSQLWMLFAARALGGILSSATLPTAMAYIGDSTSDENRGGGMGVLGAAMGLGMVLGPGLGGWLSSGGISTAWFAWQFSLATPFFAASGMSILALIFIYLVLPESLPPEAREVTGNRTRGPQFKMLWQALFGPLGFLLFLAFLLSFAMTNFEGIFGLWALKRFAYSPKQVGTLLTVVGLVSAGVQGILTGPLTKRWGEATVIKASLLASTAGFLLMLAANSFPTVLLTVGLFVFGNTMLRPAVSSLTSRQAKMSQGIAMGLNNSFMSLGRIIGPLWAGFIFDINISFPYLTGAAIMLIGFFVALRWLPNIPVLPPSTKESIGLVGDD